MLMCNIVFFCFVFFIVVFRNLLIGGGGGGFLHATITWPVYHLIFAIYLAHCKNVKIEIDYSHLMNCEKKLRSYIDLLMLKLA